LIDDKIHHLGAKPAFPVNLSINEIAAHYTPSYGDESVAHGLIKIDIGISVDGYIADTAFSVDLENDETNKKLIEAANDAITFEFWNKMDKKSTTNTAGASITVLYKSGGKAFANTTFDKNIHDWTKQRLVVKPLEAYSQISVVFFNENTTSKIWLDQTSLTIKTGTAASGAKTSPSTIKGNDANALLNSF
jgi:methionine aminopeptidase